MARILRKIIARINHLTIVNKMMMIYAVGGLIPMIFLSFYLIGDTRGVLMNQATQEAMVNASRLEERLDSIFSKSADISDALYLDGQLRKLIQRQHTDQLAVIDALKDYTRIDDYLRLYPAIESIRIYNTNATLLDNSQFIKVKPYHLLMDWYRLAIEQNGKIAYLYRYDDISHQSYLSLVRQIKDDEGQNVAVLVINMSNREWRKMVAAEPYEIIGIVGDERVFISGNASYEGAKVDSDLKLQALSKLDQKINRYNLNSLEYQVIRTDFETHRNGSRIRLLTIMPTEILLTYANESIMSSMILISISIVVAVILVYLLTRIFSDGILQFRKNIHKVALGDFDLDYSYQGDDEIGSLFTDLEIMTKSIQDLLQKEYESAVIKEQLTLKQREAEFKMLTSQIDPHFLYNTLETIRMEAVMNNQQDIALIIKKLAAIMRRKLSVSEGEVSLDSELELIQDYMDIQKFRFGDKLSFEIVRKCDTQACFILPLLLQPIVENALIHGLEGLRGKGGIKIVVEESVQFYRIAIVDNGKGISTEVLDQMNQTSSYLEYISGESIGLTNVIQRVNIFYGKPYHVSIESLEGQGTTITFHLPKTIKSQEA